MSKDSDNPIDDFINGLPKTQGLPVIACLPGSGASVVGILPGDIVIEVNGLPIDGVSSYIAARKLDVDTMRVGVLRNGVLLHFVLQLASSTVAPVNARGQFSA